MNSVQHFITYGVWVLFPMYLEECCSKLATKGPGHSTPSLDPLQCEVDRSECHAIMMPGLTMLGSSGPQVYA